MIVTTQSTRTDTHRNAKEPPASPRTYLLKNEPPGRHDNDGRHMPIKMERVGPAFFVIWVNVVCPYLVYRAGWHPPLLSYTFVAWLIQMTGALACYHRYFSHRGYKAGRVWTVCMALMGISSGQAGPLCWADYHRWHHKHCELKHDIHSPVVNDGGVWGKMGAFVWAQGGYLLLAGVPKVDHRRMVDWVKYPELVFLDKAAPFLYYGLGGLLWWGVSYNFAAYTFCLSTLLSMNCVQLVNSAAHLVGMHKYHDPRAPQCDARNIWWLTPLMLGANWHANHHSHPHCARAGFEWWELDPMYWIICSWEMLGLVWDLQQPDREVLQGLLVTEDSEERMPAKTK